MLEPIARELDLEIFEMEVPNSRSRVLRIYLTKSRKGESASAVQPIVSYSAVESGTGSEKKGVSLDECALFSKRLSRIDGFDDLFHGQWTLEVSSPGINRRLTRPEHFEGALGERVKVKFRGDEQRTIVSKGVLTRFDGNVLTIEDEDKGAPVMVDYALVNEARVDFLFTRER